MLLSRRAAKEDFSTCTDDYSEAYTDNGEPNAIEKFLYDASNVVATVFPEAASMDAVEDYSTDTDISEAYTDAIAGEPKVTFKSKLLGRRAACTSVCASANTDSPVACNDTSAGEPNVIENFFSNASSQVATIFAEAACMADDMRTIITTDIDEESVEEAQTEKKSTPAKTAIEMKGNPSPATLAKPIKETSAYETQEDEPHEGQPTSSRMKMKGSPFTLAKLMTKLDKKENVKQPTSPTMEAKGSPATLAKLMMKLDQKEKQIEKLKQQRNKTEQEVVETKKSIRALAVKFRDVLDGDEEDDDDQTEYDDSVWEDEERDDDAVDLTQDEERDDDAVEVANWYASQL